MDQIYTSARLAATGGEPGARDHLATLNNIGNVLRDLVVGSVSGTRSAIGYRDCLRRRGLPPLDSDQTLRGGKARRGDDNQKRL